MRFHLLSEYVFFIKVTLFLVASFEMLLNSNDFANLINL